MAKKSQRRSLRYDRSGCISGLISIFDFRHGRSSRKLLADRRRENKQAVGAGSSHGRPVLADSNVRFQEIEDGTESGMTPADPIKTSVKKLMEEEMSTEQASNKHANDSEVGPEKFYPDRALQARKNRKHSNKACKRSNEINICDLDAVQDLGPDKSCGQVDSKKASDRIDFEIIMHLLHDDFDRRSDQVTAIDEGKLSAAIKIFIDQSSSDAKHFREDGQIQHSREFMDALKRLSSNKDLLLKLLEDPKNLSLKQIYSLEGDQLEKELRSNSLPRSDFLEERLAHSKTDELINQKSRKFFRRRSKSQESFPSMGTDKCQPSNKIVILKPGPAALTQQNMDINVGTPVQSHYPVKNNIQEERSQFSFTELKRKIKHCIRKERRGISPDGTTHGAQLEYPPKRNDSDKGVGGENLGWRSPNRNHFYTERFAKPSISAKRGEKIGKPNDIEEIIIKESSEHTKPGVSNIYLEAKKHLLEMLSSGDDEAELTGQQLPNSLGRILSFSEYNYSPNCGPQMGSQDISVTAERTLSPYDGIEIVGESTDHHFLENLNDHASPTKYSSDIESTHISPDEKLESLGESRSLTCERSHANLKEETLISAGDATASTGAAEIKETTNDNQEDNEILNASCQSSSSYTMGDGQNGDSDEQYQEDRLMQSFKMDSFGECQTFSFPSPSNVSATIKCEDLEGAIDRTERPSPVSVLEPLYIEDDISPARNLSKPVEIEIQPRQIHFEEWRSSSDQGICVQTPLEDEESAFEYVEAVLLGSGLNWDEYLLRWLSSSSILESTLYDEVELFSSQSCHEQKLLFDCTNEVLEEVCDRYFGCFPLVLHTKQNIRPVPMRMNLIHEIWKGVEWHLLQYPPPQSLDQLLKKDMAKSRTWMNLQSDIQHIGTEMEETILDNLIEDAVSSFIYGTSESDHLTSSAAYCDRIDL